MKTVPTASGLGLMLLLAAAPALAGPSQASIASPGGFASACASEISSSYAAPGQDMLSYYSNYAGRFACGTEVFTGAAGQAGATASWSAPDLANAAAITVRMGAIHLSAQNDGPGGFAYQFPFGQSNGGWVDTLRIDLPGQTGASGVWTFTMNVGGDIDSGSGGFGQLEIRAFKDRSELFSDVPGFDRGGSDPVGTDRQRVRWSANRGAERTVLDVVTFAVPVTVGLAFDWGIFGSALAGDVSYGSSPEPSIGLADFSHTLLYGGSAALTIGGATVQGWTLSSASGIDWMQAAPVPEPGSGALMLAGAALLMLQRLRRRLPLRAAALLLPLAAVVPAQADPLRVSLSGVFTAETPVLAFSAPGAAWTMSFVVDRHPEPILGAGYTEPGYYTSVPFSDFHLVVAGIERAPALQVALYSGPNLGGMDAVFSPTVPGTEYQSIGTYGAAYYSGSELAPVIEPGSYPTYGPGITGLMVNDLGTLYWQPAGTVTISAVPEPAAALLMLAGTALLLQARRR